VRASIIITAIAAVCACAYFAGAVFAPVAIALFVIAVVWPLQARLEKVMPTVLALTLTVCLAVAVCLVFGLVAGWSFGNIGQAILADAARYQALYNTLVEWLSERGIEVSNFWAENFNSSWILATVRDISGRVNTTFTFWLIALTYIIIGLLEVDDFKRRVAGLRNQRAAHILINGCKVTAAKLRRYAVVRTQMSVITGVGVWLITWLAGLPLSVEWGVIAFVLNYIPFIGPFISTMFPVAFALAFFMEWQLPLALFIGLNAIQFVVGTYIEPRVSGTVLSISPSLVVFSIFFWSFVWGIFGAFIGVPITIAILAFCAQDPASRWLAEMCGAAPPEMPPAQPDEAAA
jgi:AI-2 transport protein TqsA